MDKELPLVFPTTGHEQKERALKVDVASCASPNSISVPQFWTVAAAETSHRRFRRHPAPRHSRAARTRLTSPRRAHPPHLRVACQAADAVHKA